MKTIVEAFVGLGANLGDAVKAVTEAFAEFDRTPGMRVTARSRLYRTPAWGVTDQPPFVNAVARIDTSLAAPELLAALLAIERAAGRERGDASRWGPRTLDLDLLLYGSNVIDEPGLRVPHPHLHERAFVLVPLAEIAPARVVPGRGSVATLLESMATADIEALR